MSTVIAWLLYLKYFAMFGILFLCGVGLPIPEEVTLVGSGLIVGWGDANFFIASAVCVLGILAGDSIIFGLGHHYGQKFLDTRLMRFFLPSWRQVKVARFFCKHGWKAVFFARFFAGLRIGVYAYAGSQRMRWLRFIILDFCGAVISGPTSIFLGKFAAEQLVSDRNAAARKAAELVHQFGNYLLVGVLLIIALFILFHGWMNRRGARKIEWLPAKGGAQPVAVPEPCADPGFPEPAKLDEVHQLR